MIIKSKKSGREETITKEMWAKMSTLDLSRNFTVVSNEDTIKMGKVEMPKELVEFKKKRSGRKAVTELHSDEAVSKD